MIDTAQQIMILEQILKFNFFSARKISTKKNFFFLHHLLNQLIFGKTKKNKITIQCNHTVRIHVE